MPEKSPINQENLLNESISAVSSIIKGKDDVKAVFSPVAYHRLNPSADLKGKERREYLLDFLNRVPVIL